MDKISNNRHTMTENQKQHYLSVSSNGAVVGNLALISTIQRSETVSTRCQIKVAYI
jgi:hypothetical protein